MNAWGSSNQPSIFLRLIIDFIETFSLHGNARSGKLKTVKCSDMKVFVHFAMTVRGL